jgi:serine protease Do
VRTRWPLLWLVVLLSLLALGAIACGKSGGSSPGSSTTASPLGAIPPGALLAPSAELLPSPVSASPPSSPSPPPPAIVSGEGYPVSFAPLARRADPAVATIKARTQTRRTIAEGLGTGFVYDPEGFMLTNNHVIGDATDVTVIFVDGREMKATIVGRDKHTDIAVLRVNERGLPWLPLGDSDVAEVGDWAVAIGNPFGLSHTVSAGIVSAKGRTREDVKGLDPSGYFNFLQTDASINPGNSGGPLLNMRGEVIGINAAIRANANSIGFAIPINMVKQLLPLLLRDGKILRSALQVVVAALNSVEAERLKRPDRKGAWVQRVIEGGPADRAGVSTDDVIVGFEGKPVSDPNELRWLASIAGVNKTVSLRIARLERVFDLRVTLGELELKDEPEEP